MVRVWEHRDTSLAATCWCEPTLTPGENNDSNSIIIIILPLRKQQVLVEFPTSYRRIGSCGKKVKDPS
jgi:hypothetical protein